MRSLQLINEPWCGNFFSEPDLMLSSRPDVKFLAPLYDRAANAIRQYDTQRLIFYEKVNICIIVSLQ